MELSNLHTNHNEIILPIGLKLLVKPERLRLDSAQHGPRAKEEKKVSSGQAPPRAHIRPVPPTQSAPGQVLLRPRGFTQDEADPNCEASMPSPRLHSSQGQGALLSLPLRLSPLAEPAGCLPGAQRLEGFLRQESEVVAVQIPGLPGCHRGPGCALVWPFP